MIMFTDFLILGVLFVIGIIFIFGDMMRMKDKKKDEFVPDIYQNNIWDIFIKNYKRFKLIRHTDETICYSWNDRYKIVLWLDEQKTTIHLFNSTCVLSDFNKKKSEDLYHLLFNKNNEKKFA